VIVKPAAPLGPRELAAEYLSDAQFVVVEGFTSADLPKIEVYRQAVHPEPLYEPNTAAGSQWLALVTDARDYRASVPVLRFSDTAWLYRLTDIVLQGAT
jgi:hypothetical protein